MSVTVMAEVWRLALPPTEKLVLLKLADVASDDGTKAYPGVKRMARECGVSDRTVQRTLRALTKRGLIEVTAKAEASARRPTEYRVLAHKSDKLPPLTPPMGDAGVGRGVTSDAKRGDTHVTQTTLESPIEPPPGGGGSEINSDYAKTLAAEFIRLRRESFPAENSPPAPISTLEAEAQVFLDRGGSLAVGREVIASGMDAKSRQKLSAPTSMAAFRYSLHDAAAKHSRAGSGFAPSGNRSDPRKFMPRGEDTPAAAAARQALRDKGIL